MSHSDRPRTVLDKFLVQLAHTIAWCSSRANPAEAQSSLRTPDLHPHLLAGCRRDMVAHVASNRRFELGLAHSQSLPPASDLAGGRLLYYEPDTHVADGTSEHESGGYFDVWDTPPWDTWVWYHDEPLSFGNPNQVESPYSAEFLIAWVPPHMIALAEVGIAVNILECIGWLPTPRLPTELTNQLEAIGLLASQ